MFTYNLFAAFRWTRAVPCRSSWKCSKLNRVKHDSICAGQKIQLNETSTRCDSYLGWWLCGDGFREVPFRVPKPVCPGTNCCHSSKFKIITEDRETAPAAIDHHHSIAFEYRRRDLHTYLPRNSTLDKNSLPAWVHCEVLTERVQSHTEWNVTSKSPRKPEFQESHNLLREAAVCEKWITAAATEKQ